MISHWVINMLSKKFGFHQFTQYLTNKKPDQIEIYIFLGWTFLIVILLCLSADEKWIEYCIERDQSENDFLIMVAYVLLFP